MHHQRVLVLASVMCTLALAPKSTAQETWYVDTHTCSGTGSGSAFDPFCTIQAGIDAAQDGDTVLVAAGTYRGIGNRAISFDGKAIAVRGTGGPDGCIIDCASRSYGFAFSHQESSGAILDGFTIRNGINSNGGGGIRCVNGSSPTIANCRFTSCSQSGLYCQDSAPTVSRCTFLENHADEGGAICCLSSAPIIILCDIQGNTAEFGGGICVDAGSVAEVTRCTIVGNRAAIVSGPQAGAGGGICCRDSDTHIQWCTIAGNTVGPHSGGAGIASLNANVAVDRCVITENAAAAHPLLVAGSPRDTVASRRMFSDGGGISCTGGTLTATRCILSRNTANQFGGAVCVTSSTAMLDHCTLFANAAADGAAVYASGSGETTGIGCIVWNNINTSGEGQVNGAINLTYCCISGGREGEGNIAEDPCLTECGRHLTEHSPCRSASVTLHVEPAPQDIDGEPLPLGMPVDIGADPVLRHRPRRFARLVGTLVLRPRDRRRRNGGRRRRRRDQRRGLPPLRRPAYAPQEPVRCHGRPRRMGRNVQHVGWRARPQGDDPSRHRCQRAIRRQHRCGRERRLPRPRQQEHQPERQAPHGLHRRRTPTPA